eukprot:m.116673 g.116673  ORF g.116673 m.116673 type:complete len:91 (+) comp14239_c1_seq1:57-329(+)
MIIHYYKKQTILYCLQSYINVRRRAVCKFSSFPLVFVARGVGRGSLEFPVSVIDGVILGEAEKPAAPGAGILLPAPRFLSLLGIFPFTCA